MGLRPIAAASALTLFLLLMALAGSGSPANAACVGPTGGIETCTGNANGGSAVFTAPGVTQLDVNNLTANLTQISLGGTGSTPSSTPDQPNYTCTGSTDCTITAFVPASGDTPAMQSTCSVN